MHNQFWESLYEHRSPILYRYLIKMGCPREDAEDIVQDTFVKAVEYTLTLSEENLSAWLFKVAINKYYDLCRREKRYPRAEVDEDNFAELFLQEEDGGSLLLLKEQSAQVGTVLASLTEVNQNLLVMKYDLGLSYEKIGRLLNMSPQKVKTYLYRARKAFQKIWELRMGEIQ